MSDGWRSTVRWAPVSWTGRSDRISRVRWQALVRLEQVRREAWTRLERSFWQRVSVRGLYITGDDWWEWAGDWWRQPGTAVCEGTVDRCEWLESPGERLSGEWKNTPADVSVSSSRQNHDSLEYILGGYQIYQIYFYTLFQNHNLLQRIVVLPRGLLSNSGSD